MKNLSEIQHELDVVTKKYVDDAADTKVDKIDGKQLSTNDYTTEEKEKLNSLENYTLPMASAGALGGVKIGNNLAINANGVLDIKETIVVLPDLDAGTYASGTQMYTEVSEKLKDCFNTATGTLKKEIYVTKEIGAGMVFYYPYSSIIKTSSGISTISFDLGMVMKEDLNTFAKRSVTFDIASSRLLVSAGETLVQRALTAGTGIILNNGTVKVNTEVIATKEYVDNLFAQVLTTENIDLINQQLEEGGR